MSSSKRQKIEKPSSPPAVLSNGDNDLHHLLRRGASADEIASFILQQSKERAVDLVLTTNDDGALPLDLLLQSTQRPEPDKWGLGNLFLLLSQLYPVPSLKQVVHIQDVLKEFAVEPNSALGYNLCVASTALNLTRFCLHYSDTHPETNMLPLPMKLVIAGKITLMRAVSKAAVELIKQAGPEPDSTETKRRILQAQAEAAILFGVGNCHEYSKVALFLISQLAPQLRAETMAIGKGDHAFVVLGRDPRSDPADYKSWGSAAVVCDPWSGKVYPASQLEKHLKNFGRIQLLNKDFFNTLPSFNPHYHVLRADFTLHGSPASASSSATAIMPEIKQSPPPEPAASAVSERDVRELVPMDAEEQCSRGSDDFPPSLQANSPLFGSKKEKPRVTGGRKRKADFLECEPTRAQANALKAS